jgi:hypothetical protein
MQQTRSGHPRWRPSLLILVLYRQSQSAVRMCLGILASLVLAGTVGAGDQGASRRRDTKAVMRAVVDHFAQQQPRSDRLACVGTDDRTLDDMLCTPAVVDPPAEVLLGIRPEGVVGEPASACADDDAKGFRVRGRRRPGGFILTFGRFRWVTPDRVEVPVKYCCWLGWGTAELERSGATWRVAQLKNWVQS